MKALHALGGALALAVIGGGFWWMSQGGDPVPTPASVVIPPLTPLAEAGRDAFAGSCARCHGPSAAGTDQGPPLVHPIYSPGHHADMAFVLAARQGARAHHWTFGDMPPVEGVTDQDLVAMVAYVRALQQANGIE